MATGMLGFFLAVLLSLGQSGVNKTPTAATAAQVMVYAPGSADYAGYMDWRALIPGVWDAVSKFEKQPNATRLATDLNVAGGRAVIANQLRTFRERLGIDLIQDIQWLAAWIDFTTSGTGSDVRGLLVVRAKLPADFLQRIAKLTGKAIDTVAGGAFIRLQGDKFVIGTVKGDTLVMGSGAWVVPRLSAGWKGSRASRGQLHKHLTKALKAKPALAFGSEPSKELRSKLKSNSAPGKFGFIMDVLTAHDVMVASLRHDRVDLVWKARSASGFRATKLGIEGGIDLLRASHPMVQGLTKLGLAGLRTYVARHKEYARLLRHEKFVLDYVERWASSGAFKSRLKANARARTITLSLTDKSVTRILPVSAIVPIVAIVWARLEMSNSPATEGGPHEEIDARDENREPGSHQAP